MADQRNAAGDGLGAEPGLCGACQHAKVNVTNRGTSYLRCTRAEWDAALVRYPRLPVHACSGFGPKDARASAGRP